MTNNTSNAVQSPSIGLEAVHVAKEPCSQEELLSESSSNEGSSPGDASTANDELTGPEASPEWTAELVRTMLGT